MNPPQHKNSSVRARLPKLKVRKFGGNISARQEFWDSFESAINRNETLAEIDKFSRASAVGDSGICTDVSKLQNRDNLK